MIDGVIGEAGTEQKKTDPTLDPDAIAETYWMLAQQEQSAWTFELEVRSNREEFFV